MLQLWEVAVLRWQYHGGVLLPLVLVGADHKLQPWTVALVGWRHHAICCYHWYLVVQGNNKLCPWELAVLRWQYRGEILLLLGHGWW